MPVVRVPLHHELVAEGVAVYHEQPSAHRVLGERLLAHLRDGGRRGDPGGDRVVQLVDERGVRYVLVDHDGVRPGRLERPLDGRGRGVLGVGPGDVPARRDARLHGQRAEVAVPVVDDGGVSERNAVGEAARPAAA